MRISFMKTNFSFPGKNTGVVLHDPPGDLPNPGIEPTSLMSPALAGRFFTTSDTWKAPKRLPKLKLSQLF